MNKKNIIAFIVLVILGAVTYYLIHSNDGSTMKGEYSDFAVKDTAAITKIFLADKRDNTVLLERQENNTWLLNGKHEAKKQSVEVLLETIRDLSVKSPVSKNAFNTIVKELAGKAVKVEIYQGSNEPVKVYYVGKGNAESTGSYMLLENSTVPFLMHIEGFMGYLTPRYFTRAADWRSTKLFRYDMGDIQEISVEDHQNPEESFTITVDENKYNLYDLNKTQQIPFDTAELLLYIAKYKNINFEFFVADKEEKSHKVDSISNRPPEFTYSVKDVTGKAKTITTYKIKNKEEIRDFQGNLEEYNIDRMDAIIDNDSWVVVQYFVMDPISTGLSNLRRKK